MEKLYKYNHNVIIIIFSLCIFLLVECNPKEEMHLLKTVRQIDYTYDNGWKYAYSIKILQNGSFIVGEGRVALKYFCGQLSIDQIQKIDSLISVTPFKKYENNYKESIADLPSYQLVLVEKRNDTISKYVYGRTAPSLLNEISNYLNTIAKESNISKKDTVINFISRKSFFPTLPSGIDSVSFTP